ncbi:CDP-alcohol phosphatidyltransferase family protein [candidate division KSB1 bacterium]
MSENNDSTVKELKTKVLPSFIQDFYYSLINPLVSFLIKRGVHPNFLTTLGLLLSIITAVLVAEGYFFMAGLMIIAAGSCDMVDGKVARASGLGSKFGALYDSAIDRYSETILFFGVCFYFVQNKMYITSIGGFIAISGSLMVSYIRARAEALDLKCKVGLMQRPERLIFLSIGCLLGDLTFSEPYYPISLIIAIWAIAISSNFTAIHRLYYIWKITFVKKESKDEEYLQKQNVQKNGILDYINHIVKIKNKE